MLAALLLNLPQPKAGKRRIPTRQHEAVARLACVQLCPEFRIEHVPGDEISVEDILGLLFAIDV